MSKNSIRRANAELNALTCRGLAGEQLQHGDVLRSQPTEVAALTHRIQASDSQQDSPETTSDSALRELVQLRHQAVGRSLAGWRKIQGFSQQALVLTVQSRCGVDISQQALSSWERGRAPVPARAALAIAMVLDIPATELGAVGTECDRTISPALMGNDQLVALLQTLCEELTVRLGAGAKVSDLRDSVSRLAPALNQSASNANE